jgi:signal peptidase II
MSESTTDPQNTGPEAVPGSEAGAPPAGALPGAPAEAAATPAEPVADAAPAIPPGEEPLAPGVERLPRPYGTRGEIPDEILMPRPSPTFLAVVSITSLVADVASKLWAEKRLEPGAFAGPGYVTVIENHLTFVLAKNKGGAWGLLQGQSENVRRPFFLLVSVAAIAFIVTLYRRLQPSQHALKWGLPLVLGGALGNVFDRVRYGHVIDFIDYRADWIRKMNELVLKYMPGHIVTDHWPTFNVADVAICVGVALMAIDMLTARRGAEPKHVVADVPVEPITETTATEPETPATGSASPAAAGESSAHAASGAPAPEGATDVPPTRDATS